MQQQTIKYGLRHKKTQLLVEVEVSQNSKDRYACCETSFILQFPRKTQGENPLWLLESEEAVLNAITLNTPFYNAYKIEEPDTSSLDFEYEEFEIVKISTTVFIEVVGKV